MKNNHLLLSTGECEKRTTIKGKITAIIETFQQPVERLLRTVFSLLLRSGPPVNGPLEHIIVCINGADRRTGPPEIQDAKQQFLEELRKLKWKVPGYEGERDMPLTVLRVWSRVGHGQSLDMAVPWVHTEGYILLDDDYIITNPDWINEVTEKCLNNPDCGYFHQHGDIGPGCCENATTHQNQLILPRLWANFIGGKKSVLEELGVRWSSYFLNHTFKTQDYPEFFPYHRESWRKSHQSEEHCSKVEEYHQLIVESGAWPKYKLDQAGVQGYNLQKQGSVQNNDLFWHYGKGTIDVLDKEIFKVPEYWSLYDKYLPKKPEFTLGEYNPSDIDPNMRAVVCVCVYNRRRTIANWLRAWNNAEHYGVKLAVVHSLPPGDVSAQESLIKSYGPDYYLPRENIGQDIRALQDMLRENRIPEWDNLIWFTDDCLPMRKDFLLPFLVEMSKPGVGIFGPFPEVGYCRTISFGIKKEAMEKLRWIDDITTRQQCLMMEQQIAPRVQEAGYKIRYLYSREQPEYIHWSRYSDWLWDTGDLGDLNLWDKFEEQFPPEKRIPGSLIELGK
jgi:hypothetical protein